MHQKLIPGMLVLASSCTFAAANYRALAEGLLPPLQP